MKKHDTIRCSSKYDVRITLQNLGLAGFHAVAGGQDGLTLTITEVPETEYLVQAWSDDDTQHAYCSTLEEAEEQARTWIDSGYGYAEICSGYPGEWERVKTIGGER